MAARLTPARRGARQPAQCLYGRLARQALPVCEPCQPGGDVGAQPAGRPLAALGGHVQVVPFTQLSLCGAQTPHVRLASGFWQVRAQPEQLPVVGLVVLPARQPFQHQREMVAHRVGVGQQADVVVVVTMAAVVVTLAGASLVARYNKEVKEWWRQMVDHTRNLVFTAGLITN